jgi:hypothetical protein
LKRFLLAAMFAGIGAIATFALAQEELDLIGRYDDARQIDQPKEETTQIVFTRLIYNGQIPGYYKNWYTDYPKSDRQLIQGLQRLTNLDIADHERAIAVTDPELFKYPFVYTSEPGQMLFNNQDAAIMREYLQRGGFWVMDDFWGSFEWDHMAAQMQKILPGAEIKDIPKDHPIFHLFYDIDEVIQVPSLAYVYNGGITYEKDGFVGEVKGIWDDQGRLLVVINHNTDLGDAYEWADAPEYPHYFSHYAYRVAINTILYALTH